MKNLSFFSTHLEPVVQRNSAIHNMLNTKLGCCQNQLRTCKTVQAHSSVHKLYNGMSGFITPPELHCTHVWLTETFIPPCTP